MAYVAALCTDAISNRSILGIQKFFIPWYPKENATPVLTKPCNKGTDLINSINTGNVVTGKPGRDNNPAVVQPFFFIYYCAILRYNV